MLCCGSSGFLCRDRLALSSSMREALMRRSIIEIFLTEATEGRLKSLPKHMFFIFLILQTYFCCSCFEVSAGKRVAGQKAWKRKLRSQVLSIATRPSKGTARLE